VELIVATGSEFRQVRRAVTASAKTFFDIRARTRVGQARTQGLRLSADYAGVKTPDTTMRR
jgi:hypothetical protein